MSDQHGHFGVREVRIEGFRSARSLHFRPGPVCALVGAPSVGKSNVLEAIWMLLQGGQPAPAAADARAQEAREIVLAATLQDGREIALRASPRESSAGQQVSLEGASPLAVLFLPASLRSRALVASPTLAPAAAQAAARYLSDTEDSSSAARANALVGAVERMRQARERGLVLLIEEPELFLTPQTQRYFDRLLRSLAELGNQVLYSTHEPAFLNVGRLEELALVEHAPQTGTRVLQPEPLGAEESFRALSEIDAERGELFLARAALLVEGRTEKLTLPFVFTALGHDADREQVTIVDCGGKANIRLFIRICHAIGLPCVAVHDRDAPPGRRPSRTQGILNEQIAQLAGPARTFVLAPDFEGVAGLRGHRHKPTRAWQRFAHVRPAQVPAPLAQAVQLVVALARE